MLRTLWIWHRSDWLALAFGAYLLLHWAWLLSGPGAAPRTVLISNLVVLPPSFAAATLAWRAGLRPAQWRRAGLGWRLVGLAYLADALGNLLWVIIENGLGQQPFPSWADLLYLAYYPLLLAGILLLPAEPRGRSPAFWLDALTVLVGGGMLIWHLVLAPMARQGASGWLEQALALAYPAGTLVLIFGITAVLLDRRPTLDRGVAGLLIGGLGLAIVANVIFGMLALRGAYTSGHWIDGLWTAGYALVSLAARRARLAPAGAPPARLPAAAAELLPYLGGALGFGLLVVVALGDWGRPLAGLAVGAGALAAIGAVRLLLTHRENLRLQAEQAERAAEMRFSALVQHAADVILILGPDGATRYASPASARVLGYEPAALPPLLSLIHPEQRAAAADQLAALIGAPGPPTTTEARLRHADGGWRTCEITWRNLLDEPQVGGVVVVCHDITLRAQAEQALRVSEQAMRAIVETAPVGISTVGDGEYFQLANPALCGLLGYSAAEIAQKTLADLTHPEDYARERALIQRLIDGEARSYSIEKRFIRKDGREIWVSLTGSLLVDAAGRPAAGIGVTLDITERKRSEQALAEAYAFLQTTLDSLSAHIAILDADGFVLTTNAAWRQFGAANGEASPVGANYLDICGLAAGPDQATAAAAAAGIRAVRDGARPSFALEYPCPGPDQMHWFQLRVTRFQWRETVRLVVAHEEITERKLAEQALQESEARLRALVQHIPGAAVVLFDHSLRYLVADGQGLSAMGLSREALEGRTPAEVLPAGPAAQLEADYRAVLAGAPPPEMDVAVGELTFRRRLMSVRDEQGRVSAGMVLSLDITQLRRDEAERLALQQRLQETQRLESIGTLAGGVAHDFNNLLQAVLGHAELLRLDLPPGSPLAAYAQAICQGAERAAELTAQLLAYAGKSRILLQPVLLNDLIRDLVGLARTTIHHRAHLRHELDDGLPYVAGDAVQLRQVILNLLLNASEALGEGGGSIVIETAAEALEPRATGLKPGEALAGGRYVRLTLRDSGHGMDQLTQARMFEPFFSTRFTGRGLGLAAVQGIVRAHRGAIDVESAPGRGTAVTIWLPAAAAQAAPCAPIDPQG